MCRQLLLFMFLFLPMIIFSQETSERKRVGIGVFISPEYHGIIIKEKTSDQSVETKISCSYGTEMNATFGEHFVLRAGLGYSYRSFRYRVDNLIFGNMIDPQQGYIGIPVSVSYDISFHEIQVPLSFHYKFSKPVFLGGGVDFIFPFGGNAYRTTTDIAQTGNIHGPYSFENPINLALSVSVGYRLQLNKSLHLLLEPVFRHNLRAYSLNNGHHYTVGLKTTVWIGGK